MTLTKPDLTTSLTGKWKSYPAYKDSGVEWLGEIPEHWEVKRLQFDCKINPKGDSLNLPGEMEVSFLPMECIGEDGRLSLEKTRTIEQVRQGYTYFQNEDVILAKITPCFENGKGALCQGLLNGIGFGTTELHILRANEETYPKFIFYLTKSDPFQKIGAAMMYGAAGQKRLPEEFIRDFPVSTPTLLEQQAIATFLDREIAKINTLIVKKERLIELLQEKRAALISQAVTKGLDPTVAMKDSGVEWLGEMPVHWEVKRLKFVANFWGGGTPSKENLDYWSGDIPWISPKDMKAEIVYDAEDHITEYAIEHSATRLIQPGAVLIVVRSGILRHSIPVAINARPVTLNQDMKALITEPFLRAEYLASLIRGHAHALLVEWRKEGATVESIEFELLANTPCPIPPLPEQQAIVTFIDHEMAKIDALISRIREGVEKLKGNCSDLT